MKNIFLMSFFGLFMVVSLGERPTNPIAFVAPAFADSEKNDQLRAKVANEIAVSDKATADAAKLAAEDLQKIAKQAEDDADRLDTEDAKKAAEDAKKAADDAEALAQEAENTYEIAKSAAEDAAKIASAFHCPDGIATCYSADGKEVTNFNALPASAAGVDEDGNSVEQATYVNAALPKVVAPKHFTSM